MEYTPHYMEPHYYREIQEHRLALVRAEMALKAIREQQSGQLPLFTYLDMITSDSNQNQKEIECPP